MQKGFPRPKFDLDGKSYPLPYTAEEKRISGIESLRMSECLSGRLCLVCGESVGLECSVLLYDGKLHAESGPFHQKCIKISMKLCPHIAEDKKYTEAIMATDELVSQIDHFWTR